MPEYDGGVEGCTFIATFEIELADPTNMVKMVLQEQGRHLQTETQAIVKTT